jgi:hypothetical protein
MKRISSWTANTRLDGTATGFPSMGENGNAARSTRFPGARVLWGVASSRDDRTGTALAPSGVKTIAVTQ